MALREIKECRPMAALTLVGTAWLSAAGSPPTYSGIRKEVFG
jgi:hypothetical protein